MKANYGTIGVNAKVPRSHCSASKDELTHTESIAEWALNAGLYICFNVNLAQPFYKFVRLPIRMNISSII